MGNIDIKERYQRHNAKLWNLLNQFNDKKEKDRGELDKQIKVEKKIIFNSGIRDQMKEMQLKRDSKKAVVEEERLNIQKRMDENEKEKKKNIKAANEKRKRCLEMMKQNLERHKVNLANRKMMDMETEHLINPKEI